jgi:hypothetical protein
MAGAADGNGAWGTACLRGGRADGIAIKQMRTEIDVHRVMLLTGTCRGAARRPLDRPQEARQSAVATRQKSTARRFVSSSVVGVMRTTLPAGPPHVTPLSDS